MRKQNELPPPPEGEDCEATSENIDENIRYIEKLALQRTLLQKLMDSELPPPGPDKNADPE